MPVYRTDSCRSLLKEIVLRTAISSPVCGKIGSLQFWHKEEKGKLVVIDVYRQKLRAELH